MSRSEAQLRRFLLIVSAVLFIGTGVELVLVDHYGDLIQIIPFVLCGLGLIAVVAMLASPRRATMLALRVIMSITILGGLFGIYEHLEHNIEFEAEIHPNASAGENFWNGLSGGSPLLAPNVLVLAAVLALGAGWGEGRDEG